MKVVHTKDTTSDTYIDALKIRQHVFINEQHIAKAIEIDKYEAISIHFVLYLSNKKAIATCRLRPLEDGKIKLERVAVETNYRKKNYGTILIKAAETFAKEQGYHQITLNAQLPVVNFYHQLELSTNG